MAKEVGGGGEEGREGVCTRSAFFDCGETAKYGLPLKTVLFFFF